jgi:hypothetical protein
MLPVRFDDIGSADVLRLVEDKASEHRTLEYKEKLSIDSKDDKAEFLADISSFANASGGDIIFGISDDRENGNPTGIPSAIVSLTIENAATECGKIERLIHSGIQPRIPVVQVKAINIPEQGQVIVVRIGKSWIAPHMVSYANRTRFFSRNSSTGKVQLDVQQIGAAFAMQRGLGERLRSWKTDRIAKAIAGGGPVALEGPQLLYHFTSAATVGEGEQSLPRTFEPRHWGQAYRLMSLSPENSRYNADGFLATSIKLERKQSYLQVFRDGSLEYGDSYVLNSLDGTTVPSQVFETKLIETFDGALSLLKQLEVEEPLFVTLTLVGVKGMTLALPAHLQTWTHRSEAFDRDVIVCPDILIQNLSEGHPYPSTLLPLVNSIWQAAGRRETPFLDGRSGNIWGMRT